MQAPPTPMQRFLVYSLAALLLSETQALDPRRSAARYSARGVTDGTEIGARRLSFDEVSKLLSPLLNQNYVIVEIGIFPAAGQPFSVSPDHFTLRIDGARLVKPVEAQAVLAEVPLLEPPPPPRKKTKAKAKRTAAPPSPAARLSADALRTTTSASPFAGYLYFPVAGGYGSRFEIEFYGGMRGLKLPL